MTDSIHEHDFDDEIYVTGSDEDMESRERKAEEDNSDEIYRKFEVREFQDGRTYKVLVIDSPEKWENASDIKFEKVIEKGNRKVNAGISCISYASNEYANKNYPIPETNDENEKDPAHLDEVENIKSIRKVLFFEIALGITIPGGNLNEKSQNLISMPAVYVDKIFEIINREACCLIDGDLVEYYKKSSETGIIIEKIKNEDLFDFGEKCDMSSFFRMQRPFQDYIIEFPLKQLTTEERSRIEKENIIPDPPMRPGAGFDVKNPVPWTDEPRYKASVERVKLRKTIQYIQACLPFSIPGDSEKEKNEWLGRKVCGDVLKLQLFIQNELVDYSWGLNFF